MADNVSISIIHDTAVDSLAATAARISARLEIAPPVVQEFNHAPYQQAMRLKALAEWLAQVDDALKPVLEAEGGDNDSKTNPKSRR